MSNISLSARRQGCDEEQQTVQLEDFQHSHLNYDNRAI